MLLLNIELIFC